MNKEKFHLIILTLEKCTLISCKQNKICREHAYLKGVNLALKRYVVQCILLKCYHCKFDIYFLEIHYIKNSYVIVHLTQTLLTCILYKDPRESSSQYYEL